jgi:hypothetical protein
VKPQAISKNPLKRVQELISLTCFSRFEPIAWGFNPRWMRGVVMDSILRNKVIRIIRN